MIYYLIRRVLFGVRISAEIVADGTFFCLDCNAEAHYDQRRWRRIRYVFYLWPLPIGARSGEFVLCHSCASTYDPECLDGDSTAELDELLVTPPLEVASALGLMPRQRFNPSGYSPGRRH